ncbi:MAG: SAM-dependent DNA methyltransferase [Propionibacteriaceae bacterium]|nr:SAM-dependent DNA methyltransferase [Propionibacteriaceae bacterium]
MTSELAGDSAEVRKARGAFFTPKPLTDFMTDWAIRTASDRVLEPSCGDGAFIAAAVRRLQDLGGRTTIRAHELHEASANDARSLLAALDHPGEVRIGDFLACKAEPSFDAVVGNPPYVRYQGFTGPARAAGLSAALAQGVRLSRLASSWAPFVIHSAAHLTSTGRLAFVLPAELLSSNYAQEVRDYLLTRFASLAVVLIERQVFAGVQTEALILLAEGTGGTDRVRFAVVREADHLPPRDFSTTLDAKPGERWTTALLSADASRQLSDLAAGTIMAPLSGWGRLSLGAVTGNNRYFTLSPDRAGELGLRPEDTVAISPPGSSHLRYLRFDKDDHTRLGARGAPTLLFRPRVPSPAARAYIARGEAAGVDAAYKCRVRSPWWRTPLPAAPHLLFTYMSQTIPQLASNPAELHCLNSVHGLYLEPEVSDLSEMLALAALNSVTALSAEVTGRAYGGGILKMEPREAARLLVPSPTLVRSRQRALSEALPTAKAMLTSGRAQDARNLVDTILFGTGGALDPADLRVVREAYGLLSERRRDRSRSRTSTRGAR